MLRASRHYLKEKKQIPRAAALVMTAFEKAAEGFAEKHRRGKASQAEQKKNEGFLATLGMTTGCWAEAGDAMRRCAAAR